ncbi:hypothetical protein ACFXOG_27480, partial [Streptomyces sp. NPDC059168]
MPRTAPLAVSRGSAREAAGTGVRADPVSAGPTRAGGAELLARGRAGRSPHRGEARRASSTSTPAV